MKKFISVLLVLVMVLGLLPTVSFAAPAAQTDEAKPIVIDFKEFAKDAAKQSWWNDLRATNIDGIKRIGSTSGSDPMSEKELAAYNAMLSHLAENEAWSIDDQTVSFTRAANVMRLFLDNSAAAPGLRFWPAYLNTKDYRDTLALTVNVPEGGAGYYGMILDMFKEAGGYSTNPRVDNIGQGGPRGHITVNGEEIYHNYFFGEPEATRKDVRVKHCFGSVWLEEGENKIQFELVTDYVGNTNNGRRALLLCGMEFQPIGTLEVEEGAELVYDLRAARLPFDVTIDDTFAVTSDDDDVAEAIFDKDHNLVITGKAMGDTDLHIISGGEELCTVSVQVTERTSLIYNFTKGSDLTVDGFDAVEGFEDLPDDGTLSDPWHHVSGKAAFSEENKTAVVSSDLKLRVKADGEGWYLPQLTFYGHKAGGSAELWLDDMYLGTVDGYAAAKTLSTAQLRPTPVEAGEYTLTIKPVQGSAFWLTSLVLKQSAEPKLTIEADALCDKQARAMSCEISGQWDNGAYDDLTDANWSVSAPEELTAHVVGTKLTVVGSEPGDYTLTVKAEINGITAQTQVPVTVLAPVALESFDVNISCVDEGILVRNTTREFAFDMLGTDGDVILPGEAHITYEVSDETVAVVDEQNHTIRGIALGDVSVTITAESGGVSFSKTLDYTVADVGENRIDEESSHFTDGTGGQILSEVTKPGVENAMCWTDVADDGTGNMAVRVVVNPNATARSAKGSGNIVLNNGHLAAVEGGQLYEMSFRMKMEGYKKPVDAKADWRFNVALYDFEENVRGSVLLQEYHDLIYLDVSTLTDEWQTITMAVRTPVDYEGVAYLTPRITYGPFVGFYAQDYDISGWEGTFWIDDFEIREVAFDHVDMELQQPLDTLEKPVAVKVTPMTSTGNPIIFDDGEFPEELNVRSTNEDVVRIDPEVSLLYVGDYFNNDDFMTVQTQLVGLNAAAQAIAEVTVGNETRQGVLDLNVTTMPDVLRDVRYTLDGFDSIVLSPGQTADGAVTGRTTQLAPFTEQQLHDMGSVYFKSGDVSVVKVDAVTGDITCVGEGQTVLTAYVNMDGITRTDTIHVTVTDDTDLASIAVSAPVDYVGVTSAVRLTVSGKKVSGVKADMALYPVAWSVDDETVAAIDDTGRLTGLKEGLVTVTASIGVQGVEVSDYMTIRVVDGSALPGEDVILDFTDSRILNMRDATLEKDGMQINYDRTYQQGASLIIKYKYGLNQNAPVGSGLSIDFMVPADGWYALEARGGTYSGASIANIFVDGDYGATIDFTRGGAGQESGTYNVYAAGNTFYLTAGVHTVDVLNATKGTIFLGRINFWKTEDPHEITVTAKAEKIKLVIGETVTVQALAEASNGWNYCLLAQAKEQKFDNYFMLTASNSIVEVGEGTITAKKPGNCVITVSGCAGGEEFSVKVPVEVSEGSIVSADLTAERTTVRPDAEAFALKLTAFGIDGGEVEISQDAIIVYQSENTSVAAVSYDGTVTLTGEEGTSLITALIDEGGHTVTTSVWITVTSGKSAPTLYTYEERANAIENVSKYSWAWDAKESAVAMADYYVENLELIYDLWPAEAFPRTASTAYQQDTCGGICPICEVDLISLYGAYPWIVDPINNPWKVQCPLCHSNFPSNDFEAYYKSGLNEHGVFEKELADDSLLVNELYPEKGEGWMVDDGFGWVSGKNAGGRLLGRTFIPYYLHATFRNLGNPSKNSMCNIITSLMNAYLYTGEEKYGTAGAILLDRIADIYPDYDLNQYNISDYANSDGDSGHGKFVGAIWEADEIGEALAPAVDAFWPAADNTEVIEFLRGKAEQKGVEPEEITPDYLRTRAEDNIILEIFDACKTVNMKGNFGMHQGVLASCAVVLDRMPETQEMVDWLFETSLVTGNYYESRNTGGDFMRTIIDDVDRDGFGHEVSFQYNRLWTKNLLPMADALSGYDKVEDADLWQNPKFVTMFTAMMRLMVSGHLPAHVGESGNIQVNWALPDLTEMVTAFRNTGNTEIARMIYAFNGNTTDGIHADIFTKDPELGIRGRIQKIVQEQGEWDWSKSDMMSGFGIAILRDGPAKYLKGINEKDYSDYMMYFGRTGGGGHALLDALKLDVNAFGLNLSGAMGYPLVVSAGSAERMQWVRNSISQNVVIVNDKPQTSTFYSHFPLHFEDAGKAKVMDADATIVYPETDIYRRTVVAVEAPNGVEYAVDFFRVLGGSEHLYSFHAVSWTDPETQGLSMTQQPMGTYAGADVPFGAYYPEPEVTTDPSVEMTGFSWLDGVSRDDSPETTFSVDFKVEDYRKLLPTTSGIHLKLTMLSEEPMTEVALANGHPPQNGSNPEHVEYVLVRRSGTDGMDTLFTTVIEPYQHENYIASSELVDVVLTDGTEGIADKAAAVKVTLDDGRVDYIIYATNPDCTYEIDGRFLFRGFTGVVSYYGDTIVYAWGNEATTVANVIENAQSCLTGKVLSFTEGLADHYTVTVELDTPAAAEAFRDKYIYVNNDGLRNAAYRIYGAEVSGNTATLDLHTQTLVRRYVDVWDLEKGFVHNISVGDTFTISLSASFDIGTLFNRTFDQVIKAGNKLTVTTGVANSGVTYAAEGMPSGMKLAATNGTLTWTTSKTQTGRYPITIKAVDADGTVLGTMSFTVYVVSYSGSSYSPDVCTHAKAVTYTFDNGDGTTAVETVCPACGTIIKETLTEEELNKFTLAGSNMTLGNELAVNFLVKATDYKDGQYAVIDQNGETTEVELVKYNSAYYAATCKVAAKELADTLSVTIMNAEGKAVSEVYEGSAKSYAMKVLANASTNAKLKTLVVDMLNYGAEAQTFFGYNEENLANSDLTAAQQKLATPAVTCVNRLVKGKNFVGSNLSLEDKIVLNMMFKGTASNGMYAEITYTDYQGSARTVKVEKADFGTYGPYIKIVVDEIVLADAHQLVTVTLYNADNSVYGSGADSVESYAKRTGDTLAAAMMKFATSAKAYLS